MRSAVIKEQVSVFCRSLCGVQRITSSAAENMMDEILHEDFSAHSNMNKRGPQYALCHVPLSLPMAAHLSTNCSQSD